MKRLRKLLYLLQLEEYQTERYYRWLLINKIEDLEEIKNKLKFTPRILITFFLSFLFTPFLGDKKAVGVSNKLASYLFKLLEEFIVFLAKLKLSFYKNLIKVVITGSYGKTTFKEKLAFVLEEKYKVLKTPGNINTRIGIASLILKKLNRNHQIFVVEASAYGIGEIRRICELIKPDCGVITIFGVMHLERFGSVKNIKLAKSELIPFIRDKSKLFVPKSFHKFIDFDKTIEKIALSLSISSFAIRKRMQSFSGVPHRVEEKVINKNITVIDNSYNSNPLGFERSLKKIAGFKGKQKIVVTPGMIELGKKQYDFNFEAAKKAAKIADIFVVVGETNKKALLDGARSIKNKKVKIVELGKNENLEEKIMSFFSPPSVILIENELPDHYF